MTTIELNIGLGNNPLDAQQIKTLFSKYEIYFEQMEVHIGEWEGQEESTVVATANTTLNKTQLHQTISSLCIQTEQDAIAYKVGRLGRIAYNPSRSGDKYDFDSDLFITL
jgi:hypothetical protein